MSVFKEVMVNPDSPRIIAKFVGEDGSLGLKAGSNYYLEAIKGPTNSPICVRITNGMNGFKNNVDTICPYDSLRLFTDNWYIIQQDWEEKLNGCNG